MNAATRTGSSVLLAIATDVIGRAGLSLLVAILTGPTWLGVAIALLVGGLLIVVLFAWVSNQPRHAR